MGSVGCTQHTRENTLVLFQHQQKNMVKFTATFFRLISFVSLGVMTSVISLGVHDDQLRFI